VSFLLDHEIEALKINRIILHVVGREHFQPQSEITNSDGIGFFLDRIKEIANSSVHVFQENSSTKAMLERIARSDVTFEAGAQELSRIFAKDHVGGSKTGAFFVIELTTAEEGVLIYSMMKYDYREAIELTEKDGHAALRQIVQAFIKERRAIQKSCIVRVRAGVAELSVSAFDKMGEAPDLTDYFSGFLDVTRNRDSKELSQRLNEAVRKTLEDAKEHLPNKDVPAAFAAAKDALRQRDIIDNDAVREAVFVASGRPEQDVRDKIDKTLNRNLKERKIDGVEFRADKQVLGRAPRRRIRTAEGISLEYPGELENNAVTRQANQSGGWTITIQTAKPLEKDETVADSSR